MKRKTKSKRGGKRPGAGRKPTGVVVLHCYPQASTAKMLRQQAKTVGASIGQVLDVWAIRAAHAKIFSE